MFRTTIQSMYKGWKGLILGALSISALLELGLKAFAHYHPEVRCSVNILAWQLPLIIIGTTVVGFTIIFAIHWIDAKRRGRTVRYRDDADRIDELEKQMNELKRKVKRIERVMRKRKGGEG